MILKKQVEYIMRKFPETRNSDILLMIELWKEYHPSYIKKGSSGELGIWLVDLYKLPTQESIKRVRAIIQNVEGRMLPTSQKVRKVRKIKEAEWLEYVRKNNLEHTRL